MVRKIGKKSIPFSLHDIFATKERPDILRSSSTSTDAPIDIMYCQEENPLSGEHLATLDEAALNFGGVPVSITAIRKYVYQGVAGLKLEGCA